MFIISYLDKFLASEESNKNNIVTFLNNVLFLFYNYRKDLYNKIKSKHLIKLREIYRNSDIMTKFINNDGSIDYISNIILNDLKEK